MSRNVGCDFFAGWISGIAGIVVGHPMDTIKTYQQVYNVRTRQAATLIREQAGFGGFFRGLPLPLMASGVLNSLFFGGYGATLSYIDSHRQMLLSSEEIRDLKLTETYRTHHGTYLDIFIVGCVAGAIQIPLSCPCDLVKVRCQAGIATREKCSSFKVAKQTYKQQGLRGFYRGSLAMFWRDVPSSGLWVLTYEWLKDYLSKRSHGDKSSVFNQFIAGGLAGSMSWIFVVPFDILKSQIQARSFDDKRKVNLTGLVKNIFQSKGLKGLTQGTIPIAMRAFPVNGVTFVAYEYFYKKCSSTFQNQESSATEDKDTPATVQVQPTTTQRSYVCRKL